MATGGLAQDLQNHDGLFLKSFSIVVAITSDVEVGVVENGLSL